MKPKEDDVSDGTLELKLSSALCATDAFEAEHLFGDVLSNFDRDRVVAALADPRVLPAEKVKTLEKVLDALFEVLSPLEVFQLATSITYTKSWGSKWFSDIHDGAEDSLAAHYRLLTSLGRMEFFNWCAREEVEAGALDKKAHLIADILLEVDRDEGYAAWPPNLRHLPEVVHQFWLTDAEEETTLGALVELGTLWRELII